MTAIIELHYLPSIAYFSALYPADEIVIEKHEYYCKQTYRNRCYINTAHGKEMLIIPLTSKHGKVCITEVRIDYGQKWLNNHWRTIQSAYGKAAFFEYYADDLEKTLFKKTTFLYDLNMSLLSMCLGWVKWRGIVKESLAYEKDPTPLVHDVRSCIKPKGTELLHKFYQPITYQHVFGNAFVENLSLIDLIFCKGPEAVRIVQASTVKMNNYNS